MREFAWNPSSSEIYYTSEHVDEPYYDLLHHELAIAVEHHHIERHPPRRDMQRRRIS